ncbi:MAG: hypothetical protein IPL29_16100 [Propionivibrio sp.]|nr:hypothetical protein [Propionivibrio sp.]
MRDVFEEMYPQHVGLLQVIHHGMERVHNGSYGDGLITKFKKNSKPRIAVSVDMLDTGIDVPEVVNLVFMKPVQSRIKLWQMIGRGTRNQKPAAFWIACPMAKRLIFSSSTFGRTISANRPRTAFRLKCRCSSAVQHAARDSRRLAQPARRCRSRKP